MSSLFANNHKEVTKGRLLRRSTLSGHLYDTGGSCCAPSATVVKPEKITRAKSLPLQLPKERRRFPIFWFIRSFRKKGTRCNSSLSTKHDEEWSDYFTDCEDDEDEELLGLRFLTE